MVSNPLLFSTLLFSVFCSFVFSLPFCFLGVFPINSSGEFRKALANIYKIYIVHFGSVMDIVIGYMDCALPFDSKLTQQCILGEPSHVRPMFAYITVGAIFVLRNALHSLICMRHDARCHSVCTLH